MQKPQPGPSLSLSSFAFSRLIRTDNNNLRLAQRHFQPGQSSRRISGKEVLFVLWRLQREKPAHQIGIPAALKWLPCCFLTIISDASSLRRAPSQSPASVALFTLALCHRIDSPTGGPSGSRPFHHCVLLERCLKLYGHWHSRNSSRTSPGRPLHEPDTSRLMRKLVWCRCTRSPSEVTRRARRSRTAKFHQEVLTFPNEPNHLNRGSPAAQQCIVSEKRKSRCLNECGRPNGRVP